MPESNAGDGTHLNRARAESFGAVAADYDRYRPSYPAELIDDLAALRPTSALDVGCGTGKAATLLTAHGLRVLGVEPDPAMAAVARGHGIEVEVGHFETWPAAGRRFDLITCAQAWHWIDPTLGAAKAAAVLAPGGTLAAFWNFEEVDDASRAALDAVWAEHAPALQDLYAAGTTRPHQRSYVEDLRASGRFVDVTARTYPWQRTESVDHWIARLGTQSDHLLLGPERLAALQAALRVALLELGTDVTLTGGTYLTLARVAG